MRGGNRIRNACGFPEFFEELEHQALGVACSGHTVKEVLGSSCEKSWQALAVEHASDSSTNEARLLLGEGHGMAEDFTRELVH